MGCREGIDPADFGSGSASDTTDPVASELIALDLTVADGVDDDGNLVPNADGSLYAYVVVGVDNLNFTSAVSFSWATADGTATKSGISPNYRAIVGGNATIPAGASHVVLPIRLYRNDIAGVDFTGKKTFTVTLSAPVNATILRGTATVTIDYDHIDPNATNPGSSGTPSLTPSAPATAVEGSSVFVSVFLSPAAAGSVTVHYATADGTAHAGTDYTSTSGTLTFAAGDTAKGVLVPTAVGSAGKSFTFNLSSPTGGAVIGTAAATINMVASGATLPANFLGPNDRVTYDEFHNPGGGGCKWKTACTGFAAAAVAGALASFQGQGAWRFNARRLFTDAGCCACLAADGTCGPGVGCTCASGCNPARVPNWLNGSGHSIQRIDDNAINASGGDYSCLWRDNATDEKEYLLSTAALTGTNVANLIKNMKQAIFNNGAIYMASHFYTNNGALTTGEGWNVCRGAWKDGTGAARNDGYILRPWTNNTPTGHAWALIGWDDNVLVPSNADDAFVGLKGQRIGCFRVQSSHGCDWGQSGRGWFPYSLLLLPAAWTSNAPRYKYFKFGWQGAA